ncbi:hypothetical protein TURU_114282 [Turdus rufiventris]|nr:hypothetical protein TURU_114282 [Turdus rufiventris]
MPPGSPWPGAGPMPPLGGFAWLRNVAGLHFRVGKFRNFVHYIRLKQKTTFGPNTMPNNSELPGTSTDCCNLSNIIESSLGTSSVNTFRTLGCPSSDPMDYDDFTDVQ